MRHRTAHLSLAAALTLLTTACSDGDDPQVLPTLTPTPSASASPVAVPAAATPGTAQGAEAFVRFFFAQLNAAFSDSNSALIEPYVDSRCGTCANYVRALKAASDRVIRGDSFSVTTVVAAPVESGGSYVDVTGEIPSRQMLDRSGTLIKTLPFEGPFHFTVAAMRTSTGWVVRAIRFNK